MIFARTLLALALAARVAGAFESERIAVELLANETPREAAIAYERACYRLGAPIAAVVPVQPFSFEGASFVRLGIEGTPESLRCLSALEPGRRGVDGTLSWFDGFVGGLVVPAAEPPVRVPEALFIDPTKATPPPPPLDRELASRLAKGDTEAIAALSRLPLDAALMQAAELAAQGTPAALASLEQVAKEHPHWRVRRAALEALVPSVSSVALQVLARNDPAWEVRLAAVEQLGVAGQAPTPGGTPADDAATETILERLREDPAPEVRRAAVWQLSSAQLEGARKTLENTAKSDTNPAVRAVAFEALAGAGYVSRRQALAWLGDPAPPVRAIAADVLVPQMEESDAYVLWRAMLDDDRLVRIAAARVLDRIDDPTLSTMIWALFAREADEVDAESTYLQRLAAALRRHPSPGLPSEVEARLRGEVAPGEQRILARLLADIAPDRATQLLLPLFDSPRPSLVALAAEAAPDGPRAHAKRLELLRNSDADLRAAAVLGLCRALGTDSKAAVAGIALEPEGLGREAASRLSRCGEAELDPARFSTHLLADEEPGESTDAGFWPAIAGLALLLASIIAIKLARPETPATTTGGPSEPAS